jgi:hypothetical protein
VIYSVCYDEIYQKNDKFSFLIIYQIFILEYYDTVQNSGSGTGKGLLSWRLNNNDN